MTIRSRGHRYTPEEYLAHERTSLEKHEYLNGIMYRPCDGPRPEAFGAPADHDLVVRSLLDLLRSRMKDTACGVLDATQPICMAYPATGARPDVSVVRGAQRFEARGPGPTCLINPTLILEVVSPSTEAADRGEKFINSREIGSLREYVLVSLFKPLVEVYRRQGNDTWIYSVADGWQSTVRLDSLDVVLPLAEIYRGAELPPGAADERAP